ncbi:hypothetical protein P3W55_28030 [Pseudomonas citronellolis]|jgi:hypothetical protein|uniref:Uncharacterized protein n=1 Tax=Pseudomonas citronellolis TaxID=53408 RepID=A0AAW6PDI4_9PSED|nr:MULTISPECIES: hypothetical protein [Pseudomonas]MDF3845573.1 hypothetical protein [Pseudomonas citronellolis]WAB93385.1 hypothetical protein OSS47_05200 [Pseudomonas citronellolis]WRT85391.1 hypothetical protein VK748_13460 [Pseudomonas citronellolis]
MPVIRKGVIVSGEYDGWVVLVDDDRSGDTGGFYLYFERGPNEGFDYWFENDGQLKSELTEYEISWET